MMEGNILTQADAEQAYTQADLKGPKTWVRLPKDQQPASWSKFKKPVCPLRLALYGHPDSGGFWERHCEEKVLLCGFIPIANWESCFWRLEWKLLLTVYVDDFKMAGPREHINLGWSVLKQHLKLGEVEPAGLYLGCLHKVKSVLLKSGQMARGVEYDMSDCFAVLFGKTHCKNWHCFI